MRIVLALINLETMILLLLKKMVIIASKITENGVTIVFVVTMPSTTRNITKKKSSATPLSLFCLIHKT
jgi:hypothetical protein